MEGSDVNSRILFDTFIPRTVQTTATHPNDGLDAAISAAVTITAAGVEFENVMVDLYVDYSDASATNFGTDIDVGFFIKSVSRTSFSKCRTRGYWRRAGVFGDVTGPNATIDRTSFYDCRFQGFWSIDIQGPKVEGANTEILITDDRGAGGASDWHVSRVWLQGWDHHSKVRRSDSDGGCYHVDGKIYPGSSQINAIQGRTFINCRFSGADPYLIKVDNAIRDKFTNCFVDRFSGYLKSDGITGVGTADCLLSLAAGAQHTVFQDTDIYSTTLDIDPLATYSIDNARDKDFNLVGERSFIPALAFGTGITYNARSATYTVKENRLFFRIAMDMSAIGTADASQAQIANMPDILDDLYVSANVSVSQSTALISPETAVVGILPGGNLGLWKSTGGTLKYTDFNASGLLYITGWAYI